MLLNEVKPLYEQFNFSGFNSESRTFGALLKSDKLLNDAVKDIMIDNDVSPEDYKKLLSIRLYDAASAWAEHHKFENEVVGPEIWKPENARMWFRRTPVSAMLHFKTVEKTVDEDEPEDYEWENLSYRNAPIYVGFGNANECFLINWKIGGCTYEKITRRGLSKGAPGHPFMSHNVDTYYKQRADDMTFKLLFNILEQWVVFK